jgi:hypothetical protein
MLINETVFYRIPETKNKQPEENRRLSAEILVRAGGLGGVWISKDSTVLRICEMFCLA